MKGLVVLVFKRLMIRMSLSTPGTVLCVAGWPWDAPPGAPGLLKAAGPPRALWAPLSLHNTFTKQRNARSVSSPAGRGGQGRSALPHPPCFSEAFVFLGISTFLTFSVLLCRFLSFFPPPQLDFGCKFFSTVQVCAYVHIIVKCLHRNT